MKRRTGDATHLIPSSLSPSFRLTETPQSLCTIQATNSEVARRRLHRLPDLDLKQHSMASNVVDDIEYKLDAVSASRVASDDIDKTFRSSTVG